MTRRGSFVMIPHLGFLLLNEEVQDSWYLRWSPNGELLQKSTDVGWHLQLTSRNEQQRTRVSLGAVRIAKGARVSQK